MRYIIKYTSKFKKEYKLAKKQHKDLNKLWHIINLLADGYALPLQLKDHSLGGSMKGWRECHIEPDWLLVYKYVNETLVLLLGRIGTHSELFKK